MDPGYSSFGRGPDMYDKSKDPLYNYQDAVGTELKIYFAFMIIVIIGGSYIIYRYTKKSSYTNNPYEYRFEERYNTWY